jgi:hypothetical protein
MPHSAEQKFVLGRITGRAILGLNILVQQLREENRKFKRG